MMNTTAERRHREHAALMDAFFAFYRVSSSDAQQPQKSRIVDVKSNRALITRLVARPERITEDDM